ncbi:MAG: hypothetical protein HQK89_09375 [Nitrospirae bacterium]|nr:hypothetical protein [Nitrospirota bacterium]
MSVLYKMQSGCVFLQRYEAMAYMPGIHLKQHVVNDLLCRYEKENSNRSMFHSKANFRGW